MLVASPASKAKLCWPSQNDHQAARAIKRQSKRCHGKVDSLRAKTGNLAGFHTPTCTLPYRASPSLPWNISASITKPFK